VLDTVFRTGILLSLVLDDHFHWWVVLAVGDDSVDVYGLNRREPRTLSLPYASSRMRGGS
jgi:hypothetical protein